MKTTINPYSHNKIISLSTDALIHVNHPDSNGNLVALLNSWYVAQYLSHGCGLAAPWKQRDTGHSILLCSVTRSAHLCPQPYHSHSDVSDALTHHH